MIDGGPSEAALRRARAIVLATSALEFVVLAVTGLILCSKYRPATSLRWHDTPGLSGAVVFGNRMRIVHVTVARLLLPTLLVLGILTGLGRSPGSRRWTAWALGVALPVATLAASFTGYLLPWDQLALRAVTIGTNISGYGALRGSDVRFVVFDGVEVAPQTVLRWLYVHAAGLGALLATLVALSWRRHMRS